MPPDARRRRPRSLRPAVHGAGGITAALHRRLARPHRGRGWGGHPPGRFRGRDLREALGLTQEFVERAGIHRTYLSDIERGTQNVSLVNIERVTRGPSMEISG